MELTDIPYHIAMLFISIYRGIAWCAIHFLLPIYKPIGMKMAKGVDVVVNGPKPWHPQIHDDRFYFRLAQDKLLGIGEAYMEGWWDCERLDETCSKIVRAGLFKEIMFLSDYLADYVRFHLFNLQTGKRSWEVAEKHYNIGKTRISVLISQNFPHENST